jgi:tetrapyrrole methylase family protein/MazG family protein
MKAIDELRDIVARLRGPDGCPWDREQSHQSIRSQLLEEAYEVLEAIDEASDSMLCEELGDLLLHIVFHARLAEERGAFSLSDVAEKINEKLIRRHPHVFGEDEAEDAAAVLVKWEELKRKEKPERESALDGIPPILPALMRAQELQKKAAKTGFDWKEIQPVLEKCREEIEELEKDLDNPRRAADEMGDVFFSLVNLCRHLGLDAEQCCRDANNKFDHRFRQVEFLRARRSPEGENWTLDELEALWQEAKKNEG